MSTHSSVLLQDWETPFGLPPFSQIQPEDFGPAFDAALSAAEADVEAIANNPDAPSFENTILALETAGEQLTQVASVFFNLSGAHTNPTLQATEREIAPKLAAHSSRILLNPALYQRIESLNATKQTLNLDAEQERVLERYTTSFNRAGAALSDDAKQRISEITQRLATLGTQFAQNVLADEANYKLVLKDEHDLVGLPSFLIEAAREAAQDRGEDGAYVITLSRSSIEPFLQFSKRRDLREKAFKAWASRGENPGETNNLEIIKETVALRHERARLLGYDNFAAFKLDDTMAKTPDAVASLLDSIWQPARARALEEAADLQDMASSLGDDVAIAPWDWRYYAEKVRQQRHELDEEQVKPYFQLDKMIEAAFDSANRLFGISFRELHEVDRYHPDLKVFEVLDADGSHRGIFIGDYFARTSKRSGAWMSAFRKQHRTRGTVAPVIVNVMNFSKAPAGEPTLLTFDDARTLFHEFGHALHGLLSDVTYPVISGTSVSRDFVELPSQLYEHWLSEPEVLQRFAVHYKTGAPIPQELLNRLLTAANFNQGFATVEYLATAIVDMAIHSEADPETFEPQSFEQQILKKIGMPAQIVMRHRTPHLAHAFAGDGYSAGYYSYIWSEVMDADAFEAFKEAGDPFHPETAARLKQAIYSAGGRQDPEDAYIAFRGKMPSIVPLLKGRGLMAENEAA